MPNKEKSKIMRRVGALTSVLIFIGLIMLVVQTPADSHKTQQAIAVLHPTTGHLATGTIIFTRTSEGVKIVADLTGISPGKHGFHIHQWGDCSAPDGTSAGGHYDPFNKPHGGPEDKERHVGDLGNITVESNGKAHLEMVDSMISLDGTHRIIGRAVILHAGEDDLKSQPTGDAGARLACGVIGYAQP